MAQIAANLQRIKNGQRRYAITPRVPAGFIQPEQLQKYIDVANEFGAVLKLTGSQRIMITNLKAEDVDAAWKCSAWSRRTWCPTACAASRFAQAQRSVNGLNKTACILACN